MTCGNENKMAVRVEQSTEQEREKERLRAKFPIFSRVVYNKYRQVKCQTRSKFEGEL